MDWSGKDRSGLEWTGKDRKGTAGATSPHLLKDIMTISKKSEEHEELLDKITKKFVRSNRKGTLVKSCLHILCASLRVSDVLQRLMLKDVNLLLESTYEDVYCFSYLEYMRIMFIQNVDKEEDLEETYLLDEKFDIEDFKEKFFFMLDLLNEISKKIK